jgi:predicted nucleic acid-binding protein
VIAVCNSTPLIHLAKINKLELLSRIFNRVISTNQVFEETVTNGGNWVDAARIRAAVEQGWLQVMPMPESLYPLYVELCGALGAGEASTIVMALELKPDALIIDERAASKKVQVFGLDSILTGTIGILVRARKKGLVPELKSILDSLRSTSFWIDDALYWKVLKDVGEG